MATAAQPPAPTPGAQPGRGEAKGPAFAVGIGIAAILISGTMAIASAVLLYRGDTGDDVVNTLPAGCDVFAVAPNPLALQALRGASAIWAQLPAAWTPVVASAADTLDDALLLHDGKVPGGADPTAAAGVCRKGGTTIATIGVGSEANRAVDPLLATLASRFGGGQWQASQAVGGFVDYALVGAGSRDGGPGARQVAALAGPARMQLLWGQPDAPAALAKVVGALGEGSARGDVLVRGALERVGAGALQVVLNRETTRQWAALLGLLPPLRGFVHDHGHWLGASLRADLGDGRVHGHVHIGTDEAGATVLKSTLDAGEPRATSAAVGRGKAGGVIRLQPKGWLDALGPMVAHPRGAWLDATLRDAGLDGLRGTLEITQGTICWRVAAAADVGPRWWIAFRVASTTTPPASVVGGRTVGDVSVVGDPSWIVVVPGDVAAGRATLTWLREHQGADADATQDRTRILDDSQGFYVDAADALQGLGLSPMPVGEAELIWLDTGLVIHVAARP